MNYEQFNKGRAALAELVSEQLEIIEKSDYDNIVKTTPLPSQTLTDAFRSLSADSLNTLVMGRFSSGKSVFLDALLGDELLPTDVRPCTAVIGEIVYGDTWKFTLFPKDKNKDPFIIQRDELKDYIVIPHEREVCENPYSKVIIEAPLSICRNGIRLIDSPGLDDPTSHDEVTRAYLPNADAIIYCMPCGQAYTNVDKNTIQELRNLGYTTIIFVLTFFDQLEMNDMMYGTDDAQKCKTHYTELLAPLTDLGRQGIFFVNSRGALKGKMDNNPVLFSRSHFDELESSLEKILAEEKGKLKLTKVYFDTSSFNTRIERTLQRMTAVCKKRRQDLEEQVKNAEIPFAKAQERKDHIVRQIDIHTDSLIDVISSEAKLFYDKMVKKVPNWIERAESKVSFINVFKIRERAKEFTEDIVNSLKLEMENEITRWGEECIEKKLQSSLERLAKTINQDISGCVADLREVMTSLELDSDVIANEQDASTLNRVLSGGAAIFMGDLYGLVAGGVGGYKMMIRTMACEIAAYVVLYVVSLFTPVGLPAMIIGCIFALIAGSGWNVSSIASKIRKKIEKEAMAKIDTPDAAGKFVENVSGVIRQQMEGSKQSLEIALQGRINEAQKILDCAKANLIEQGGVEQQRYLSFENIIGKSEALRDKLEEFYKLHL